jgi:cytochrome c-type biogenesis protein CcmH/NrfG
MTREIAGNRSGPHALLRRLGLGFAGLIISLSPLAAAGRYPEEFTKAIQAQDQKDWARSAELLREALQRQPEDGVRVKIYGTRFQSYLPYYYLGLALFKQKLCSEALQEWDQSLRLGFVQKAPEYEALLKNSANCAP